MSKQYIITEESYSHLAYKIAKIVDLEKLREVSKIFNKHMEEEMSLVKD